MGIIKLPISGRQHFPLGFTVLNLSSLTIQEEALWKVQKGLPSLESFTKKMTN